MKKLGTITIGQSPRVDVTPEMLPFLPEFQVVEKGALDGLGPEELAALAPKPGENVLVSRLRDGSQVTMSKQSILHLMQQRIDELQEEGVEVILLLCTGHFPTFECKSLLLEPDRILNSAVRGLLTKGRLGVINPVPAQREASLEKWERDGLEVFTAAGSPYLGGDEIEKAAHSLKEHDVDLIVLDCIGYTEEMKRTVKRITGKPVILSRTLVARVLGELG
ncbi:AroM family protein [Brevibacillus borstelensis]|uniref:AroM family protein n=1 Tax=Brevibacillus borstelensis TaxID=45462 RepID=UPI0030BC306B